MTSLWGQGPCRPVLTAFILLLSADCVAADYSTFDSMYAAYIGIPFTSLILISIAYCSWRCRCPQDEQTERDKRAERAARRLERRRIERAARERKLQRTAQAAQDAESGNQVGRGSREGTGTQQADGQTPPYVISNGAYPCQPSYGYPTNYNTVFIGSPPTDANKTGPEFTEGFPAPGPSYDDVTAVEAESRRW